MKGHVPTPPSLVDVMVSKLFAKRKPKAKDRILDPGCGDGPFIDGILRYCKQHKLNPPQIIGVELDPRLAALSRERFSKAPNVKILEQDYLGVPLEPTEFIIGNPPYVSITGLDAREKKRYRAGFASAVGRFDLYLLFFERSLSNLKSGGRLVFITPEKFEYVHTAEPLRQRLAAVSIEELHHVDEETFPGLVTYPTITTIANHPPAAAHQTRVIQRDGSDIHVMLPNDGTSWNGTMKGRAASTGAELTLKDITIRVSCGIATGTDEVFVQPKDDLPKGLHRFAYPTVSGRQLGMKGITTEANVVQTRDVMLVPYDAQGKLLPEGDLGDLRTYLRRPDNYRKLSERTHVAERGRAYYRFHDNVPLPDLLRPKIICKDIAPEPVFWADRNGDIVPRHSAYYIVPKDGVDLDALLTYLNGPDARAWIKDHVQRAANGFYRLQSTVMKRLPVPDAIGSAIAAPKPIQKTHAAKREAPRAVQTLLRS